MWEEIQSGFNEAANLIAQAQGADLVAGNTVIAGRSITGAYGLQQTAWLPLPGGGYRKKTAVPLRIPRSRLAAPPEINSKVIRTDRAPHVVYTVDHVETQDPVFWIVMLVNFAG